MPHRERELVSARATGRHPTGTGEVKRIGINKGTEKGRGGGFDGHGEYPVGERSHPDVCNHARCGPST